MGVVGDMWRSQRGPGRNIEIEMFRNWRVLVTNIRVGASRIDVT